MVSGDANTNALDTALAASGALQGDENGRGTAPAPATPAKPAKDDKKSKETKSSEGGKKAALSDKKPDPPKKADPEPGSIA